jgi:molecular chaperone DnaJ
MTSAALGTEVIIETFDGPQKVEIKEGTQSGSVFVLKGLGVTKLRGAGRGDLVVHIEVNIPGKVSKEQGELLKKFAQLRNEGADKVEIHTNKDQGFFSKVRNAFR